MTHFAQIADLTEQAARKAGQVLLDWQGRAKVTAKAPADLVTEADFAAQKCIQDLVTENFPEHDFLGEESTPEQLAQTSTSAFRWIVDPLDGTTNFVHGLPYYCVSIAVEHEGKIIAGTIYDPVHDDCFRATIGEGAFRNGERISTSNNHQLSESLVVTGFPPNPDSDSVDVRRFVRMLNRCHAVRRMGAAALNMCHLAAGSFDVYWARTLKTWDVAAGLLFIQEAGGTITAIDGGRFDLAQPNLLAAATPELHAEVLKFFASVN